MITQQVENIWNEFNDKLRGFISKRVENDMAAEDILQEVFLKIHAKVGDLRDVSKMQSWIYAITRNAITDYYRSRKIYSRHQQELNGQFFDTLPEIEASTAEDAAQRIAGSLKGMIGLLPEKYSEALLLTVYHGMSQVELAKKLGISLSGAKSRVQRGRQLLKEMLEKCCHFELDRRGMIMDYHRASCSCCSQDGGAEAC
jgi:RNA polymerase sigma-70 factor (ECF subfamily)